MAFDAPWPADRPVPVRYLLAAERGTLAYDRATYPIHAVPNTVLEMIWRGLLADTCGPGPVLTDAGRVRLAQERTRQHADDQSDENHRAPMTAAAAAWIREHVWPAIWLRGHQHIPGTTFDCACQKPPSCECQAGRHSQCRHDGRPMSETVIQTSALRPARLPETFTHLSQEHPGLANDLAWVWLAGPPCRQLCNCACHDPAAPAVYDAEPQQLALFA